MEKQMVVMSVELVNWSNKSMNTLNILYKSRLDSLGYDTIYLEKPMSNLIDFDWKNILSRPPSNSSQITINELKFISQQTKVSYKGHRIEICLFIRRSIF
jgi:hypothetical protein